MDHPNNDDERRLDDLIESLRSDLKIALRSVLAGGDIHFMAIKLSGREASTMYICFANEYTGLAFKGLAQGLQQAHQLFTTRAADDAERFGSQRQRSGRLNKHQNLKPD
jgi:hypothetical protein